MIGVIGLLIFLFLSVSALVSVGAWIKTDDLAKKYRASNKRLLAENERLKAVIAFHNLQNELEEEENA